jgi:hypothetical protein
VHSPHLHRLLAQAHIDDMHRRPSSQEGIGAERSRPISRRYSGALSSYLKRAIAPLSGRAARDATATLMPPS